MCNYAKRRVYAHLDRRLAFRLMFWTNWNELAPSIMRASLSGANVLVIVGNSIRTPNGLAIDHRAEKLYFSDATLDKIERCEYDGTNRFVSALVFVSVWVLGLCVSVDRNKPSEAHTCMCVGGLEERARAPVWPGCVWRVHLLDGLGAQSCAQSG